MRQSTKDSQANAFYNAKSLETLLNLSQTGATSFTRAGSDYRLTGGKHYTENGNPAGYQFQVLRKRNATHYTTDLSVAKIFKTN